MKICFITGTLGRGGAEKQLVLMLEAILRAGGRPRVLCLTRGEAHEDEIRSMGVPVEWVGRSGNRLVRLAAILDNIRRSPADIIQSSHFYTNIYAGCAGRLLGIPSIGAVRGDLDFESTGHGLFGRWQTVLPHFLIANSTAGYTQAVARRGPDKADVVPNGVAVHGMDALERNARPPTLLWAGRLDENKRPEMFIRMAAELRDSFEDLKVRFRIAGDGPRRQDMEKLAAKFRLDSDTLHFAGRCDRMSDVYRQADILVVTSDHEGTPNVVLEAMAHGLPVIATRTGGIPEIVDETRGILVDRGDGNALLRAAKELIRNPERCRSLGQHGIDYVTAHHSIDSIGEQLFEIYGTLNRSVLPQPLHV